jgi:hypothetical protein
VRLYTWRRARLADEVGSDAMPDAAGGEGGHGAASTDRVVHRYRALAHPIARLNFVYTPSTSQFKY